MKKFHIYIDESEIEGNIILGAIVVPSKRTYAAERRITDLRKRVLREMQLHDYPILRPPEEGQKQKSRLKTERARLAAGGLPEIHAAELWSGDVVFWKKRDGTDILIKRHRKWLEQCLALVTEFDVTYRRNVLTVAAQERLKTHPEVSIYQTLRPWLTADIREVQVLQLQNDPYIRLLFGLLQGIEQVARAEQWQYTIICDKGKKNEIFKVFDTFTLLKRHGSWQNLQGIDFQDSHDNGLLQLCDVATYVDAKADYLPERHNDLLPLKRVWTKYLKKAWRHTPAPTALATPEGFFRVPSMAYAELMAMLTEMALLHSGGLSRTLPLRRQRLQDVMDRYPDVFLSSFPVPVRKP